MTLRTSIVCVLALATCLLCAPAALADDICVGSTPTCPVEDYPATPTGFQNALTQSNTLTSNDRVFVKAGNYNLGSGYSFTVAGSQRLDLIGAGSASTHITCALVSVGASCFAFTSPATSVASSISGFSVAPTGTITNGQAIGVVRASASDIVVNDPGTISGFRGMTILYGTVVDGCTISLASSNAIGVYSSNGTVTLRRCTISGGINSIGVAVGGNGPYVIDHTTIRDIKSGISAQSGTAFVSDSLVDLGSVANATAIDAYIASSAASPEVSSLELKRVTVASSGVNSTGVYVGATATNRTMDLDILDSVIYGTGAGFKSLRTFHANAAGSTSFDVTHTAYDLNKATNEGTNPIVPTAAAIVNLAAVAPGFTDVAARNYRPAAGSALIDAGPDGAGFPIAPTDVSGAARVVDGNGDGLARVDLGALEYQPPAPPPGGGGPSTLIASAKIVSKPKKSFAVAKKGGFGKPKKGAPSFSVKFTNSAKAKFTLKSIGKKKKLKSVKGSQTLTVKDGTTKFGFRGKWNKKKLKAGKYRVTITPLSSAGAAGKPVTVDIKLK